MLLHILHDCSPLQTLSYGFELVEASYVSAHPLSVPSGGSGSLILSLLSSYKQGGAILTGEPLSGKSFGAKSAAATLGRSLTVVDCGGVSANQLSESLTAAFASYVPITCERLTSTSHHG